MDTILQCIIVEDEPVHSNRLKKLLASLDSRVNVAAVCNNIEDALQQIDKHAPQLVFLDIQLHEDPRGGFALLKACKHPAFDVVFTTAHIDKNIQEIRRCGIGYLPKPYDAAELQEALSKVWEKQVGKVGTRQLEMLLQNLVTEQLDQQQIWINQVGGSIPVKIGNLVMCKASNQYTELYVLDENNGKKIEKIITSKRIREWGENLAPVKFCRCHDSYIVNLRFITKIKSDNLSLQYFDDPIPVSRAGKERLELLIKNTSPLAFR